jgi:hypothetical protein
MATNLSKPMCPSMVAVLAMAAVMAMDVDKDKDLVCKSVTPDETDSSCISRRHLCCTP